MCRTSLQVQSRNVPARRHALSPAVHRRKKGEIMCPGPRNRLLSKHKQYSHVSALPLGLGTSLAKLS